MDLDVCALMNFWRRPDRALSLSLISAAVEACSKLRRIPDLP
jgi:hypothetical protein